MARASDDDTDKSLWLTLAQSWVRLAEHVADSAAVDCDADEVTSVPALQEPD